MVCKVIDQAHFSLLGVGCSFIIVLLDPAGLGRIHSTKFGNPKIVSIYQYGSYLYGGAGQVCEQEGGIAKGNEKEHHVVISHLFTQSNILQHSIFRYLLRMHIVSSVSAQLMMWQSPASSL